MTLSLPYQTGSYPSEYVPIVFDNYEVHAYHRGEEVSLRLWDKAASDDDGASRQNLKLDPSRRLCDPKAQFSISAISLRAYSPSES